MTALLAGAVVLTDRADRLVAEVAVDAADEVFDGHYPFFALLPGMYLLDLVTTLVVDRARAAGVHIRLATVRSARFAAAVLPGDTVMIECAITEHRDVRATCRTGNGNAATFKLTFSSVVDSVAA